MIHINALYENIRMPLPPPPPPGYPICIKFQMLLQYVINLIVITTYL